MSNKLGIMAASILAGVSAMPFSPFGNDEPRRHRPILDGIKDGLKATQADLLAKSHGKQSKRAKRRKGEQ